MASRILIAFLLVACLGSRVWASEQEESKDDKKPDASYIHSLQQVLQEAFSPAVHEKASVSILFRISPEGKVSCVETSDASSSPAVNRAARDCIYYAQPLPKLPAGTKFLDVKAVFESDLTSSKHGGYCRPTKEQQREASKLYKEASLLVKQNKPLPAAEKLGEALVATPFNYAIKRRYVDILLKAAKDLEGEEKCHLLHKAILCLPGNRQASEMLTQYWKEKGVDLEDHQQRYRTAVDYDKQGKPIDALAEFCMIWKEHKNPEFIDDINLVTSHYLAMPNAKKWKKYYDRSPTPQMMQQLSKALKEAGAYEEARQLSGDEKPIDIDRLYEEDVKGFSSTKFDTDVPFILARSKTVTVSKVEDRMRKVDYLAHAIKQQKAVIRWTPGRFPLTVFTADGRGVKGYSPAFRRMVIDCFNEWAEGSEKRLSFTPVSGERGANIVVRWTSNPAKLPRSTGREQGITHFRFMKRHKGNYNIIGAEITILTMHRQRLSLPIGVKGMRAVILHELGHALGISGHSPYRSDIMYPMMTGVRTLSSKDKATIVRLYQGYEH